MKLYAAALVVLLPCLAAVPVVDKGKAQGMPTAPVRIEIFGDFTCSHCKLMHETMVPQLMKDYVVPGKVYLVDRSFPLPGAGHEYSREAFGYAVAAARINKYQQVADVLYAQQASWALGGNVWAVVAAVLSPAEQTKVKALAKDPGVLAEIDAEYQEGIEARVSSTPTLVVTAGPKRYALPTAPNYSLLKSMIDGLLPK
jgi:protein-disulfide isomerase